MSEIVEVGTQTRQLFSFSHERSYTWIVSLSAIPVLNGLGMSAPFVVGRCFRSASKKCVGF